VHDLSRLCSRGSGSIPSEVRHLTLEPVYSPFTRTILTPELHFTLPHETLHCGGAHTVRPLWSPGHTGSHTEHRSQAGRNMGKVGSPFANFSFVVALITYYTNLIQLSVTWSRDAHWQWKFLPTTTSSSSPLLRAKYTRSCGLYSEHAQICIFIYVYTLKIIK
jgi:hypothetical protein